MGKGKKKTAGQNGSIWVNIGVPMNPPFWAYINRIIIYNIIIDIYIYNWAYIYIYIFNQSLYYNVI